MDFFLPCYHFIYNLALLGSRSAQIDTGGFYTLVSHEVSKQGYVVELFKEVFGKAMTEGMWINYVTLQSVLVRKVFQLHGKSTGTDALAISVEKDVTTRYAP